jgi:uncharacterized protein (TIGR02231 family)
MPELASQVVAVTVFTDRVRVTRRGQATLRAGSRRLEFTELPASLDPASLRVAARGTVPAKLLGVDGRMAYFTDSPAVALRELEDRLQALQDEEAVDTDRSTALDKHLAHLDGLGEATRIYAYGLANGKTTIDQQTALLVFLERERSSLQERARAVAMQRRQRAKEIDRLRLEIQRQRAARPRERYAVAVEVAVSDPGDVEVDVTYVLPHAAWRPLYDLRLRGADLELTYLAEIQQNTGEDWAGVAMTLSTARPALAAAIPRLTPWHLQAHQVLPPPPPAAMRAARSTKLGRLAAEAALPEALMTMAAVPGAAALVEADLETATVEESAGSVVFQIPGSVDVPSDNSPHKATVGIFRLRPQFDYVSVPKLAGAVFRRAKVTNTSSYTLLPGRAQLFLEDDFLGAADLVLTAPGQQFDLFFGADDRLRVERGLTKRDVSKSFLGGRRRIHYAYEIKLGNHTDAPQKLTVVDQIPCSQHEDIKVTLDTVEPRPDRQDDFNIVIWKLTLEPGAQQKISFAFTVEHPREMAVDGLGST